MSNLADGTSALLTRAAIVLLVAAVIWIGVILADVIL